MSSAQLVLVMGVLLAAGACSSSSGATETSSTTAASSPTTTTELHSTVPTTTTVPATTTTEVATTTTEAPEPIDGETGSISVKQSFDGPVQTSTFDAAGEAVEDGMMCSHATGFFVGNEDEDGNLLSDAENDALYVGSEPFVAVTAEEMTCADGTGVFVFRVFTEIDPSNPDYAPSGTTWTITGSAGYETTTGEGESSLPEVAGEGVFVWTATGTIIRQNSS